MKPSSLVSFLAISAVVPAWSAHCETAPPQLREKSITVTWVEAYVGRIAGQGGPWRNNTVRNTLKIYVGSTGKPFARHNTGGLNHDCLEGRMRQFYTTHLQFAGRGLTWYLANDLWPCSSGRRWVQSELRHL